MRLRFSLKCLLLLLTCVACCLGYQVRLAQFRRAALTTAEAIEAWTTPTASAFPDWMVAILGPEFCSPIEGVHGLYSKVRDEHLAIFSRVPELQHVSTNHAWVGSCIGTFAISGVGRTSESPAVTDAGVATLARCRNLRSLILFHTSITDEGIALLSNLPRLEGLMIQSPNITDESIPHLLRFRALTRLWVGCTSISAAGVERLEQGLPNCEITAVSEEVAVH